MINEGLIANDSKTVVKSEMMRQLWALGPTDPDTLERAVFRAMAGGEREDVDWDFEDNQAGYFTWIKSFDQLITELVEDGHLQVKQLDGSANRHLVPTQSDGAIDYSLLAFPR